MSRIYVACLASYNNGRLFGEWIDVSSDVAEMSDKVNEMLRRSPFPNVIRQIYRDEDDAAYYVDVSSRQIPENWTKDGAEFRSAEEYAIHDYDGFPNLGEYPGLQKIADVAAFVEDATHGLDAEDVTAVLEYYGGNLDDAREALEDKFCGKYDEFKDYAEECADQTLEAHGIKDDHPLFSYFDVERYARDLAMETTSIDVPSGVLVFHA